MADVSTAIATYQMDLNAAGYTAGAKNVDSANKQMLGGLEQVAAGEERVTVTTAKVGNEFEKLEAKASRVVAIEQRRVASIAQVIRVAEEEGVGIQRRNALIDQLNAKYDQQVASLNRVRQAAANQNTVISTATGATRNYGTVIQQAGFQVGDFAVQIASGQNALRAFIQQGSQMAGAFGPAGAVLGALGAVIGAVVTSMGLFGSNTDSATKSLDLYNDALETSNELMLTAKERSDQLTSSRLAEAQSSLSAAIQEESLNITRLNRIRAEQQKYFQEIQGSIPSTIPQSGTPSNIAAPLVAELAGSERRLAELEARQKALSDPKNLGVTRDEAAKADEEAAKETKRLTDEREKATQSIADQIEALGREADQLKMTARDRAIDVELQKAELTARRAGIELTDIQIGMIEEEAERKYEAAEASKAVAEAERERERAAKEAAREAERAAKQLERELQRQGDIIADQAALLTNAALGWEDWRDVAKQAINTVIMELAKLETLGGQGGGLFSSTGLLGSLIGAVFSGAAGGIGSGSVVGGPGFGTARAGGGDIAANTNVLVGERGPEIIRARGNATVIPNHALGGTTIVNHNTFDFRNAIVDEAKIESRINRALPRFTKASEADISDKRRRGALPAFR